MYNLSFAKLHELIIIVPVLLYGQLKFHIAFNSQNIPIMQKTFNFLIDFIHMDIYDACSTSMKEQNKVVHDKKKMSFQPVSFFRSIHHR